MALDMQTPDGRWTVEVYRRPKTRDSYWYRLRHGDSVVEDLSIASVARLLEEAGYELADLQERDVNAGEQSHGAA
jgi:hypothetical protein